MKNIYFTIALLFFGFIVSAQTAEGEIVNETSIIKRIASDLPVTTTDIKPVLSAAMPSISPTGNSTEVGITDGKLSVSLNGNANYTIPIAVPKGINNVEPQISLNYNSQNGLSGTAARGWDISGVSSITRIPATKFHDGVIDPVDFNVLDRFSLDGQRLIVKSGTTGVYGADRTVYETEYYSNIRITSLGVSPNGANYGPAYFLVEYPDGSKAYYGNSTDSRSIMEWSILYFENAQGVCISYSYLLLNNTLYIDSIKYGAIGKSTPPNEVKFIYEDRGVPENYYVGGQNVIRSNRLKEINSITNGIGFRNYSLSYLVVDRINKVTETSGDKTKSYNPTLFDYEMTSEEMKYLDITTSLNVGNINSLNVGAVSGDFDGDGKMDCLVYPTLGADAKTKYWLYAGIESGNMVNMGLEHNVEAFDDIFPATFLSSENKILPQGWAVVKKTNSDYIFTLYGTQSYLGINNIIKYYDRVVSIPKTIFPKKMVSGDFNGDGLTDVMIIDSQSLNGDIVSGRQVYFIDLKRDNTPNFLTLPGQLATVVSGTAKVQVADFNGDGKSDLFVFDTGFLTIYSLSAENKLIVLYRNSSTDSALITGFPYTTTNLPILIGDYNGDGKSDVMIPKAYGSSQWYKYTSTGTTVIKEEKTYLPVFSRNDSNNTYNYIVTDYNNDGKTDLVKVLNYTENAKGYINIICYSNINGDFIHDPKISSTGARTDINIYALPVFLPQNLNSYNSLTNRANSTLEIAFFNQNKIHFFNSGYDYKKSNLLTNITTGNGVQETISYIPLDSQFANTYQNTTIYKSSKGIASYPNLDITIDPNLYVVSKLEKQSKDVYKKRLFAYYGAVSNTEGLGFMGFRSVSQTDWYNETTDMFSNITKNDIDLRGASIESYFTRGFREPLITVSGTNNSPNTPADFITKALASYESNLFGNKVFKLKNTDTKQFNTLTNTNKEENTYYDEYNNVLKSTVFVKEGSSTIQTTVSNVDYYNNSSGATYIIGRPLSNSQSVSITDSTMSSEENYDYNTNGLIRQIRRKGTNTDYITEDNEYDRFGNIINKKITAVGLIPRETNYEYDIPGRFLIKSANIEGLSTSFIYNSNGTLKSETNPYGLTTSYEYDSWFKKIATIDYLGKKNSYVYTRSGQNAIVTSTTDDGGVFEETFDDLGRKTRAGSKNIMGTFSYVDYFYDNQDRNYKVSEPYFGSAGTQWNEIKYDAYGRVIQNIEFTGKTTNINYSGLVITVNDGLKTKKIVKNAIGNIVSMTDSPSGTIKYSYYANDNLKESDCNGTKTIITQDGWGRKTKLEDSSGTYTYSYNTFGETISETTPNGMISYILDPAVGKIMQKTINGSNTNSKTTYSYDTSSKLLQESKFEDLNSGISTILNSFIYDASKRLIKTVETTPYAEFTKEITYDDFGRVNTETSVAKAAGKSSSNTIKNTYKNGFHWQILHNTSSAILWQLNTLNAKGQLLTAQSGPITTTQTYDNYGYPLQYKYDRVSASKNIFTINTVFDVITGNLTRRTDNIVGRIEDYKYDAQDRLTEFQNFGIKDKQSYDVQGRITGNNLGVYNYSNDKPFQNTSITLTPESVNYYTARPTQSISYNVFKSPVQIEDVGIDKISFHYNDNNSRSAMFYGGLQTDKFQRPLRKYYSADGTMEIKENMVTGALEFVTFVGGDGYTAPIVLKSNGITQDYLFLQRDYLGSILCITDVNEIVLEWRLFDAWGGVCVKDGKGKIISGLTVLDRGYTGHEHLQSVGLINMNARLYDPMLHRFLQVDNYIQDPTNTQNYNQYSYVLNNPLKYIDPSGNVSQGGGGDCKGCGINVGPGDQTGSSFDIEQFGKDYGIDKWLNKNFNLKNWDRWRKDKISLNNIFGRHKQHGPPPNMSSYANLNTTSFTGTQMGMNNFNSSITHDVYRITPTTSLNLKNVDWEKVAGKTSEIGTSTALIASSLEIGGLASPFMKGFGTYAGNIAVLTQVADNTMKVRRGKENGGISLQRYGYRMIGTGTSWGVSYAIAQWGLGGAYAGPYGVIAGIVIGAGFQGIEYSYDIIAPQIQSSYNGFVNNLYSASYNAQFSGR